MLFQLDCADMMIPEHANKTTQTERLNQTLKAPELDRLLAEPPGDNDKRDKTEKDAGKHATPSEVTANSTAMMDWADSGGGESRERAVTVSAPAPPRLFTMKQVAAHASPADMWIVVDNEVYDVTEFQLQHPGGAKILLGVAGKDATKKFDKYHRRGILEKYKATLRVGLLDMAEVVANSKKGFLKKLGFGIGRSKEGQQESDGLRRLNTV
ncbi:cytochrome b5-like heme/steroid binding domain-containing protein [Xylariaceae sp. FL0016]|nr:cytochrome b5-like heme/steroid binding domain-containing protein [Xylariaceae sp. FL0016]